MLDMIPRSYCATQKITGSAMSIGTVTKAGYGAHFRNHVTDVVYRLR